MGKRKRKLSFVYYKEECLILYNEIKLRDKSKVSIRYLDIDTDFRKLFENKCKK